MGPVSSQTAFIEGVVKDASSGNTLPGVNVFDQNKKGTTTDGNGYYKLELQPGEHIITFSFIGYKTHEKRVSLQEKEQLTQNVQLFLEAELLDVVVVSAGKFEQSLSDITVSMEVIKPKLIQDRNTTTLESMLQVTPGVTIIDNEPQIRSGSGFSFGAGSRVQILIDDLPILSGDAGRPTWSYLPIENLEQMEIIKGASSVLYGSSALSGVINLRTAYPRETPRTEVTLFTGRYSDPSIEESVWWNESNSLIGGLSFLHSRKIQSLDLVVSGNYFGDQGYIGPEIIDPADSSFYPEHISRNGFENRGRISVSLRKNFEKTPGLKIGLNTNFYKSKSTATLLWLNADTGLYRPSPGSLTFTDQDAYHIDPFIEYYSNNGGKHALRSRLYSLDNLNTNNQSNFSDVWYSEYQYTQHFDSLSIPDLVSTFGTVYEDVNAESDLFAGNDGDAGKNNATKLAFYLQLDKKFFDKLSISLGVRNENFEINGLNESATIFRSGLNYKLAEASFLRASFGQGFRFPSIGEKFIKTNVSSLFIYPNTDLRSEKSWNLELGLKQGFKLGQLKGFADLALFQQEFERFIEFTFGQWGPISDPGLGLGFRSLNTGDARVTGLELSIVGFQKINDMELNLMLGYTYTKPISLTPNELYTENEDPFWPDPNYLNTSSDTAGHILKYRMQHAIRGDIGLDYKKFHLGISGRYNSNMANIDRIFEDLDTQGILETGLTQWRKDNNKGDAIFDLRGGFKLNENTKLSLIITNLLNRAYAMRPLAIEAPRLFTIQFKSTIK
ncbi:MAG: TonB-dependent receptor [Flavobacteriales bacterium]|nr:TonB-dependent receptor [Flavobacteriales bacterium]